jgi:hypothetical protein
MEELSGSGKNTYQLINTTLDNIIQKLSVDHYWSQ